MGTLSGARHRVTAVTQFLARISQKQSTFVAVGNTTTLTFASTVPDTAYGPAIDDVTVTACPSSCALSPSP